MSRLSTLSPNAIKQFYTPDADDDLIFLLTLYDEDGVTVIERITDSFNERISETDTEVIYGIRSRGYDYIALPLAITLPSEEEANAPRSSIVMYDVTKYLTPIIRTITGPVKVKMEMVLTKSPDTVEVLLEDFEIRNFNYNQDQVTGELTVVSLDREPFPMYTFSPAYTPGIF